MRAWLKPVDEIDRDCIHQWERLLKIKFRSYDEYSAVDGLIGDMILDYENKKELKMEYPNIETDVALILKREVI